MTFFYPLRNKTAFDIFDKAYQAAMQEAKQSTYGARRASYMCSLLLARVVGPRRFERRTSRLSAVRTTWLCYGPLLKLYLAGCSQGIFDVLLCILMFGLKAMHDHHCLPSMAQRSTAAAIPNLLSSRLFVSGEKSRLIFTTKGLKFCLKVQTGL
jgi:hypothetical protein